MVTTEGSRPPLSRPSRNFLKCAECRRQRRKCEPEDRDWQGKEERCLTCIAGGHACGPNVWHPSRQQRLSTPAGGSNLTPLPQLSPSPLLTPPSTIPSSSAHSQHHGASSAWSPDSHASGIISPPEQSPLQDRGKAKVVSRTTQQRGLDAGLPNPVEAIRSRLNRQGTLCDLYAFLHARNVAATSARPVGPAQEYEEVDQLFMALKDCVRYKFMDLMNEIWSDLHQVPNDDKELLLHYFRDEIIAFLSIPDDQQEEYLQTVVPDDNHKIRHMHCRINYLLAAVCESANYRSAASRFRREVVSLKTRYRIIDDDLADIDNGHLYLEMSTRITETFRSLDIPARFARLLPQTDNVFPPFSLANDAGHSLTARDLLANHASERGPCDLLNRAPPHVAAETGDNELLEIALNQYNDAKTRRDVFSMTALCIAAYMGHEDIFIRLAETDEDINVVDITGRNVLCIACGGGHLPIVRYLVEERGCRPNDLGGLGPASKYSPLHAAAAGGHSEVVDLLIRYDASALWQYQGLTPAQEAERNGHNEISQRLKEIERQQEAILPNQVGLTGHAYYLSLAQNPFAVVHSVASSPFTQTSLDQPAETRIPSELHPLMHPSPTQGETSLLTNHPSTHSQFSLYDDFTIGSISASLASQSSRQPSEAPSPAVSSLKRPHAPSHESSPRSGRLQPSLSTPMKRHHTCN